MVMNAPPPRRSRAALGRANRSKGHKAERELARYLRQWWPDARRAVSAGWRTGERTSADRGDIAGTPALCWQVKNVEGMSDADIAAARRETQDQAVAAGADFGLLVQRRPGKSDPGRWWCWLELSDVICLLYDADAGLKFAEYDCPSRWAVADVVDMLLGAGHGDPLSAHLSEGSIDA